jgi:hypothetical protein
MAWDSVVSAGLPSTSADTLPSSPSSMLSDADNMPIPQAFQIIHEKPDENKDLAKLVEIFRHMSN